MKRWTRMPPFRAAMLRSAVFRAGTLCAVSLTLAATASAQSKPVNWAGGIPEPFHTPSASNRPRVVKQPDGAALQVPAGFKVEEYATSDEFERPRFMATGPSGEIVLSDSGARNEPNGGVFLLKDGSAKKILSGLDRPFGLAFHEKWLYVAEPTSVKRYPYDKNKMTAGKGEEIIQFPDMGKGHWTRSLLFTRDHKKLYVTVGSGSNIDLGEDPMRAALHRYNPDGSGHEAIASGLRNTIGLQFYPGSQEVWGVVQERDGLGDDLVSDYLVNIKKGAFYGWPYAYSGPNEEPRHKDVAPDMVKKTQYPDVLLGAHVAVLDIRFYTGKMFPEKYRNGLFLAFHGSWNRSERVGYNVSYIPFKDGKPQSGPQDFMTGWLQDPGSTDVWGRPVGLHLLEDGSMLVSDDGGKKIWRISHGE